MAFDNISVSSGIIDSTEGNPIRWDLYGMVKAHSLQI